MANGQHLFWGSQLGRPSLKALPLGPRGHAIGLGGHFMSQASTSLESLSIPSIQNRILATPPLEKLAAASGPRGFRAPTNPLSTPAAEIPLPTITEPEKTLIQALAIDPSSTTLDDLGIIDGFFGGGLTSELCNIMNGRGRASSFGVNRRLSTAQAIYAWMTYKTTGRGLFSGTELNASSGELEEIRSNPFFCGSPMEFPEVVYGRDKADYAGWFDIDQNGTWGSVKLQVKNAMTVMSVVGSYPFPPPLDLSDKAAFWILSIGEIREIVHTPLLVNPEAVRIWITMTVLANYSAWVDQMEREEKKKAKKAKRKMIMTAIGLAVASLVAAFLLPAIIAVAATAIKTGITTYIDAQKRRKAAKDMANASKMFADDAPGFAKEVDHAAAVLDEQAARDEAAASTPPDVQAAIDQVKAETGPAWGTILPVGGGIAAAGLVALAIFK